MMLTCAASFRAPFSRLACEPCPATPLAGRPPGRGGQARRLNGMTAALTLLAIVLTGCGPTKQEIRATVHKLEPLAEKTDENFVLNNCRLGSAALAEYDLPTAEAAFLRAYEV